MMHPKTNQVNNRCRIVLNGRTLGHGDNVLGYNYVQESSYYGRNSEGIRP